MSSLVSRIGLAVVFSLGAPASFAATAYADAVVSFGPGPGTPHPHFQDPLDALGSPDYADPSNSGFGVGAVALGAGGTITLHMSAGFSAGGTSAFDLRVYEIGPSQGGTAERTTVSVSADGSNWITAGVASGGTSGIDLDGAGVSAQDVFRYVRLTDLTGNAGQPAGADIDAIAALSAVPEPPTALLGALGLVPLLRAVRVRRANGRTGAPRP